VAQLNQFLTDMANTKDTQAQLLLSTVAAAANKYANAAYMPADQQPQETYYFCGPASIVEAVTSEGYTVTGPGNTLQQKASYYSDTNSGGTNWSGYNTGARVPYGTGYPMVDALNYYIDGSGNGYYTPVAVAYYPTSTDYADYNRRLQYDIYNGWNVVGDAYEVVNGPHLVGHPNANIFHWFEIRGYDSGGSNTAYEDSVSGATSVGWYRSVPPYSTLSSKAIADIVGGRGYIW
jgi:hypothetical protein